MSGAHVGVATTSGASLAQRRPAVPLPLAAGAQLAARRCPPERPTGRAVPCLSVSKEVIVAPVFDDATKRGDDGSQADEQHEQLHRKQGRMLAKTGTHS